MHALVGYQNCAMSPVAAGTAKLCPKALDLEKNARGISWQGLRGKRLDHKNEVVLGGGVNYDDDWGYREVQRVKGMLHVASNLVARGDSRWLVSSLSKSLGFSYWGNSKCI